MIGGIALSGAGVLAFMRKPDIPHAALDRRYADSRSSLVAGPSGLGIHVRDEGPADAPAILLIHGYCASLHTWEHWTRELARDHRVISLDLPGHGLTRTPAGYRVTRDSFIQTIDAVARHFDLDRFSLVGNSMGGAAAWDYASRRPAVVEALVLIGSAGWTPRPDQDYMSPEIEDLLRSPLGPLLRDQDNTNFMRQGLRASFARQDLVREPMVQRYAEMARAPMNRDVQLQLALNRGARLYASPDRLRRIEAPTLILHGTNDRLVPVSDGYSFAENIRHSELIVYQGVGHILHEEIPEESLEDMRDFLSAAMRPRHRTLHAMAA
jgi:pimeloyl-ACP methyl ester carboxylesterase